MGREVKRVPIDFNWPMHVVWKGYMCPYSPVSCKQCGGSGLNKATKEIQDSWYGENYQNGWNHSLEQEDVQALIDADRLWDFTRIPLNDEQREIVKKKIADGSNSWLPFNNGRIPTAQEVNAWSRHGFGHDSINRMICVEAKAKRLGVYGKCELCHGEGQYWCEDKYEELYQNWERIEPPNGEGWQMWETTSEGSPISPVFQTPELLASWLADNGASSFGRDTATYDQWFKMISSSGWAMSAVSLDGHMMSGVEYAAIASNRK